MIQKLLHRFSTYVKRKVKKVRRFFTILDRKRLIKRNTLPILCTNIVVKAKSPEKKAQLKIEYEKYAQDLKARVEEIQWGVIVQHDCGGEYMKIVKNQNIFLFVALTDDSNFFTEVLMYADNHDIPIIVLRDEHGNNMPNRNYEKDSSLNYFCVDFRKENASDITFKIVEDRIRKIYGIKKSPEK